MKGILGKKIGMSQIFDETGKVIPVTAIQAGPCRVVQVKTASRDGYDAVQLGFEAAKVNRPRAGHFARAGLEPQAYLRELPAEAEQYQVGQQLRADVFEPGERVDVVGTSRGKGFQGGVRRWGFGRGPMTHGSKYHRGPGSLAPRTSGGGGHVHKGRRMPGHLGNVRVTVRNLTVVRVDPERNLLLIRGAVPGARGSLVLVRQAKSGKGR